MLPGLAEASQPREIRHKPVSAGNLIEFYRLWPCHIPNRSTGAIMVTRQLVSAFSSTDILGAALWLSSSDYDCPSSGQCPSLPRHSFASAADVLRDTARNPDIVEEG